LVNGYGEPGQGGPELANEPSAIQQASVEAFNPANEDYLNEISNQRNSIVEYEVQAGDTLSFIASDYGVSVNSIIWANKLSASSILSTGQILKIPPITGVIHEVKKGDSVESIAKKYSAEGDKIIEFNALPKDGSLQIGKQIVIPDGKIGGSSVASSQSSPSTQRFSYLPNLGDFFRLPTTGFNWGRIHGRNGVDMANSCGTPIYSSAEGTVTAVDVTGWNGGFGKYLKISHSNGTETLYAHASKITVEEGQNVAKGEQIALMGTTGRSTGCHLHFEVHGAKNPLSK
jgi:murein DD-endopeptidase MepM/ murein hydrolase activator NlpD